MKSKPFSAASDNNKDAILSVLQGYLTDNDHLLEIGSGTGQHARYFSDHFPRVIFQPSDLNENLEGISAWRDDAPHNNILPPLYLDVRDPPQTHNACFNLIFSANTAHIMSMKTVEKMFSFVSHALIHKGFFILYGPFNEKGEFTSESNRSFDAWLKRQSPEMGIRDRDTLIVSANNHGLHFHQNSTMPKNNQILIFQTD